MPMNRRNFLSLMVGGVAAAAAVRTFPFRVFSFPKEIKIVPPEYLGLELENVENVFYSPLLYNPTGVGDLRYVNVDGGTLPFGVPYKRPVYGPPRIKSVDPEKKIITWEFA